MGKNLWNAGFHEPAAPGKFQWWYTANMRSAKQARMPAQLATTALTRARADSFAYERRAEVRLVRSNQVQFARKDDVVGRARTVHEHDVAILAELVMCTAHGHQWRDTRSRR